MKRFSNKIAWILCIILVASAAGFVYFEIPVRVANAASQQQLPTSDENNSGSFTTTPFFSKVNDASDATLIVGVANAGGHMTFGFTAFSVSAGSTITNLVLHYRCRSTTTSTANNGASIIKVGGTYYGSGDTAGGDTGNACPSSGGAVGDFSFTFTTNPKTSAAWTVAEINGTDGTNPLQAFGVGGSDFNPDVNFYDVDATVNYTPLSDTNTHIYINAPKVILNSNKIIFN